MEDTFDIHISEDIKRLLPGIKLGCLYAGVVVMPSSHGLLDYIANTLHEIKKRLTLDEVSRIGVIASTREAYRKLGKDPARYRPSAEALTRRIVQGKDLYRVNNIVDALNIVSIKHGFSIGGYDAEKLNMPIGLGIGRTHEPYEAIGRGALNIGHLPVLRDRSGAFGSPTSDSLRTMVRENTRSFLMVFFDFQPAGLLEPALLEAERIFRKYCGISQMRVEICA